MGLPARKNYETNLTNFQLLIPTYSKTGRSRTSVVNASKTIAWFVFLFIGFQLFLNYLFAVKFPEFTDPPYSKRIDLLIKRTPILVDIPENMVVLGSSRSELGLNAPLMENKIIEQLKHPFVAINFSTMACAQETQLLYWERILRDYKAPSMVIIEVLPAYLNRKIGEPGCEFNEIVWPTEKFFYKDLELIEKYASNIRPNIKSEWLQLSMMAFYKNRSSILNSIAPSLVPKKFVTDLNHIDKHGQLITGIENLSEEQKIKALEITRAQYFNNVQTMDLDSSRTQALRTLLESCRKNKVAAAMLIMPEGPEFRSWYGPGVITQIENHLFALSKEFGVKFFNTHNWMKEFDFKDSHHMFEKSSLQFTRRFTNEKIIPWIQDLEKMKSH